MLCFVHCSSADMTMLASYILFVLRKDTSAHNYSCLMRFYSIVHVEFVRFLFL